jgi:hypothetical protein
MPDGINGLELREGALSLMRSALGMIDQAGGPADAAAHLDLAICRLEASCSAAPRDPEGRD